MMDTFKWKETVDGVRQDILDKNIPVPLKPEMDLSQLVMPEDIEGFHDVALANLKVRYTRWYAYATGALAFAKAELAALKEVYELNVGERMFALEKSIEGKKPAKEVLRGQVVIHNDEVKELMMMLMEHEQKVLHLEGLNKSLEITVDMLRDEQIRRASARKVEKEGSF